MQQDQKHLEMTIELAKKSVKNGNHPFGSLLVGPNDEVLLVSGNSYLRDKGIGHAEMNIAQAAAKQYSTSFLESCTLYTSVEPCCMCAGACYWAGIGTVVYGLSEKRLAELTLDNPENLTLDLSCHKVFEAGQRKVQVRGPFAALEDKIVADHINFW